MTSAAEIASVEGQRQRVQVITDIDDTIKSSGGVKLGGIPLGGIDVQYERGQFYPGVVRFMLALASGQGDDNPGNPLPVAVLTARAREFLWALQLNDADPVVQRFKAMGEATGHTGWGIGTVLYGSVAEWIIQNRKGWRKFENFKILMSQSTVTEESLSYIFVGDTGEQDEECGERMLREFPTRMRALFLHVVSDQEERPDLPKDYLLNGIPVVYFRTYVGAATRAVEYQLMSLDGLRAVIEAACDDLRSEPRGSSRWEDISTDVANAETRFPGLSETRGLDVVEEGAGGVEE